MINHFKKKTNLHLYKQCSLPNLLEFDYVHIYIHLCYCNSIIYKNNIRIFIKYLYMNVYDCIYYMIFVQKNLKLLAHS